MDMRILAFAFAAALLCVGCGSSPESPEAPPSPTPSVLSGRLVFDELSLSWTKCPDEGFVQYNLYSSFQPDVTEKPDTLLASFTDASDTTFAEQVPLATTLYLAVETLSGDSTCWSNVLTVNTNVFMEPGQWIGPTQQYPAPDERYVQFTTNEAGEIQDLSVEFAIAGNPDFIWNDSPNIQYGADGTWSFEETVSPWSAGIYASFTSPDSCSGEVLFWADPSLYGYEVWIDTYFVAVRQ